MKPSLLQTAAYHYELPKELIAQYPSPQREESRLMHLHAGTGEIAHRKFRDIQSLLKPGDLLVLNNSKVFPARLYGSKENGSKIEILLLNPCADEHCWNCLAHPGKRLKEAQWLYFSDSLKGYISKGREDGQREIRLEYSGSLYDILAEIGHIPLPPYIARQDEQSDKERYQTVYAKEPGSVAAPTAGLHFSKELLAELVAAGIQRTELSLHVGIGTFRPVKSASILQHTMHAELVEISQNTAQKINQAKSEGRRIVAVGTTTVRSLESFWQDGALQSGKKWTDIFIYPGYQMQVPDALITNFHLPESTLLMMISAFAGYDLIQKAYQEAVAERYRFFSYGDAMYIEL